METPIAEVFVMKTEFFLTPALKSFGTKHYRAQLKPTLQAARGLLLHCIYRLLYPFAISSICDQKITLS